MLNWKGSVFSRQREARARRGSPELARLNRALRTNAVEQAALWNNWPKSEGERAASRAKLEALKQERERAEAELYAITPDRPAVDVSKLKSRLGNHQVLIDLFEFQDTRPPGTGSSDWCREPKVVAFVVRPGFPVALVELGPAQRHRRRGRTVAEGIGVEPVRDDAAVIASAERTLYDLVRKPLDSYLAGARTVLVSPEGSLARFPAAALPGARPGTYLNDEAAVVVVPVPQLLGESPAKADRPASSADSILVVGDVDYGQPASPAAARRWKALPSTSSEARDVVGEYRRYHPGGTVHELTGTDASAPEVREPPAGKPICSPRNPYVPAGHAPPSRARQRQLPVRLQSPARPRGPILERRRASRAA